MQKPRKVGRRWRSGRWRRSDQPAPVRANRASTWRISAISSALLVTSFTPGRASGDRSSSTPPDPRPGAGQRPRVPHPRKLRDGPRARPAVVRADPRAKPRSAPLSANRATEGSKPYHCQCTECSGGGVGPYLSSSCRAIDASVTCHCPVSRTGPPSLLSKTTRPSDAIHTR